jgi:hypothetical protein
MLNYIIRRKYSGGLYRKKGVTVMTIACRVGKALKKMKKAERLGEKLRTIAIFYFNPGRAETAKFLLRNIHFSLLYQRV